MAAGCIYAGGGSDYSGAYSAGAGNGVQGGDVESGAAGHGVSLRLFRTADYPAD